MQALTAFLHRSWPGHTEFGSFHPPWPACCLSAVTVPFWDTWLCTEGFLPLCFPLPHITPPFSADTRASWHTFSLGLTKCGLPFDPPQNNKDILKSSLPYYPQTEAFPNVSTTFSLIIPINFPMNSCSQPRVLAALDPSILAQSLLSASSERFQTAVQEMRRMLLLFSRWVLPPHSWVSGNTVIGLLCSECYMSLFALCERKYLFLDKPRQPFPLPFLFSALDFQSFHF